MKSLKLLSKMVFDGEGNAGGGKKVELTENQKKTLENAIKKQKKFMDGDITKKKLSKKDKNAMDAVDEAGMSYVDVAGELLIDGLVKNFLLKF